MMGRDTFQINVPVNPWLSMIRKLKWGDMEDLVANYYSYYDEVEGDNPDLGLIFHNEKPNEASEAEWFTGLYKETLRGDAVCFVAEIDGRVAGICDVHRVRPGSEVSHKGVLGIALHRDFRGMGLGRELIEATLEECRKSFEIITLGVFTTNERAIALYRKLGFEEYGKLERSAKRNGRYYDEILMQYRFP